MYKWLVYNCYLSIFQATRFKHEDPAWQSDAGSAAVNETPLGAGGRVHTGGRPVQPRHGGH